MTQSRPTRDLATAGGSPDRPGRLAALGRSLAARLVLTAVVFCIVPVLLYEQFRAADAQRRAILMQNLAEQGRMIAEMLRPRLEAAGTRESGESGDLRDLAAEVQRLGAVGDRRIKLLLRPAGRQGGEAFYYIAYAPEVSEDYLRQEREKLARSGVLARLQADCAGSGPLAASYTNPAGEAEILTSITPLETARGCWAVITSRAAGAAVGTALDRPYWQTPEVQAALVIYAVMAALVLGIMLSLRRSLRRFARGARAIRSAGPGSPAPSFRGMNRVPELDGIAAEFDRMVATLRQAAQTLRHAAEDNAHAFKTPIATIAQSLEPVKRQLPAESPRAQRAVALIEGALTRLDHLVSASRRLDRAVAEVIEAPREPVDLGAFAARTLEGYAERIAAHGLRVEQRLHGRLHVAAAPDMLETVLENLLDNAMTFSPPGGTIEVALAAEADDVVLTVADEGPGVVPERLEEIFERYVSSRHTESGGADPGAAHFGVGLWLVRRNIEALQGRVYAEAAGSRGLRVVVRLPRQA